MKRCIREHEAPGFGTIPVGSLWADDSPFIGEADAFRDILDEKPKRSKVVTYDESTREIDEVD